MELLTHISDQAVVKMAFSDWETLRDRNFTSVHMPFLSQRMRGAYARRNDCGPTCIAMAIKGFEGFPDLTVDDIAIKYQKAVDQYTTLAELQKAARDYHLSAEYKRPFMAQDMADAIKRGSVTVALVKYSEMPIKKYDFGGWHFILVYGVNDRRLYYRDPLAVDSGELSIGFEDLDHAMSIKDNNMPHQGLVVSKR